MVWVPFDSGNHFPLYVSGTEKSGKTRKKRSTLVSISFTGFIWASSCSSLKLVQSNVYIIPFKVRLTVRVQYRKVYSSILHGIVIRRIQKLFLQGQLQISHLTSEVYWIYFISFYSLHNWVSCTHSVWEKRHVGKLKLFWAIRCWPLELSWNFTFSKHSFRQQFNFPAADLLSTRSTPPSLLSSYMHGKWKFEWKTHRIVSVCFGFGKVCNSILLHLFCMKISFFCYSISMFGWLCACCWLCWRRHSICMRFVHTANKFSNYNSKIVGGNNLFFQHFECTLTYRIVLFAPHKSM